jgi:Zn-finger nucleic acid-binding protein
MLMASGVALADKLRLADGTAIEVEEAWEDAQGVWYRRGGVTHLVERSRVRAIERAGTTADAATATKSASGVVADNKADDDSADDEAKAGDVTSSDQPVQAVWIYLVGGAKVEVDEANETAEGVWYRRGNLSIFIERARVDHVERERLVPAESPAEVAGGAAKRRVRGWSTGSARLDSIIRENGARHGVDPYLIFCVMEQESHFNSRAVSPMGARGLMQLMPATAARFGVRDIFDPRQNIEGGTRYIRFLLDMFGGDVRLALAGYNAGEGAVLKYGRRVPPYSETQEYVRRIMQRYTLMRDPQTARRAITLTPAQVADIKPSGAVATGSLYERNVYAVRMPDGKLRLVSQ